MLIMKCSACDKYISSALLAEISSIRCEHCGAEVPVRNVLVSANGFTFDRNDLLKRFFRYRRLLDEVIDERNALQSNQGASAESRRSIEQFLSILQGMMTGARDHYRCQFEGPVSARLKYSRQQCPGHFVNLSMEGACVEIAPEHPVPRVGSAISIEFSLPKLKQDMDLRGKVCWVEKGRPEAQRKHHIGIQFDPVEERIKTVLWGVISDLAANSMR